MTHPIRDMVQQYGVPAQMGEFLIVNGFDEETARKACQFFKANGGYRWGSSGWGKDVADQSKPVEEIVEETEDPKSESVEETNQ